MNEEIAKTTAFCYQNLITKRLQTLSAPIQEYSITEVIAMKGDSDFWGVVVTAQRMSGDISDINTAARIQIPLDQIRPAGVQSHVLLD